MSTMTCKYNVGWNLLGTSPGTCWFGIAENIFSPLPPQAHVDQEMKVRGKKAVVFQDCSHDEVA